MSASPRPRAGFSFVELLVAITVLALLVALSFPSFRREIDRMRVEAALDRVVAEVYRARMTAVQRGAPVRLVFRSTADGCIRGVTMESAGGAPPTDVASHLSLPGLCLRHSGDSVLVFNSRGMIRPPARSFHVRYGAAADSALLSIAGRIRRSY